MIHWGIVILLGIMSFTFGIRVGIGNDKGECTDKCRVKELELQKEIDEYKWRYELVNDIKN